LKICPFAPPDVEKENDPSGEFISKTHTSIVAMRKSWPLHQAWVCGQRRSILTKLRAWTWFLARPILLSFTDGFFATQSPGPVAGITDTKIDRQERTMAEIAIKINHFTFDTIMHH
jgi:hypothetical protein